MFLKARRSLLRDIKERGGQLNQEEINKDVKRPGQGVLCLIHLSDIKSRAATAARLHLQPLNYHFLFPLLFRFRCRECFETDVVLQKQS